jgi:hypothetical protein
MAIRALPLNPDCVGLWRFQEALATDSAVDAGPYGYDLTDNGSPAVVTPGVVGTRARRIVNGDYFARTSVANLRAPENITVAAIIVPLSSYSAPSTYRGLVYLPQTDTAYWAPTYGIRSKSYQKFDFQAGVKLTGYAPLFVSPVAPAELEADVGHLVAFTFSKVEKLLCWYVDGALVEAVSTAPYDTLEYLGSEPFIIGCNWYNIGAGLVYYAGCDIDEVGIYSSAKTAGWVAGVYEAAADGLFALSAVSLEFAPLGIARKAVPMESGATLPAANSLFSVTGVSLEFAPLGIANKLGTARSGS